MANFPKKVKERFNKNISRFQRVLQIAKDRDLNESDTVQIVNDILAEVFGYDKYLEVTSEFAIRGTYCDLAIKIEGKIQFLIEVKAIGTDLKDNHLRQVIQYGANQGIQWVILTNGIVWQVYKIQFEQPICHELVCNIDFIQISSRREEDLELLYIICKEGLEKDVREEYHERIQSINRFIVGALITNNVIVNAVRKELRKFSPGIRVENDEIKALIENEVLKRDILKGEEAESARKRVQRYYNKLTKKVKPPKKEENGQAPTEGTLLEENN